MKQFIHHFKRGNINELIPNDSVGTVLRYILLLFALALHFATIANAADPVYDFEGLTSGQTLFGQDNWEQHSTWTGDIQVTPGIGVNGTSVATAPIPVPVVNAGANRSNDAQFSSTPFQGNETNAVTEGDFRAGSHPDATAWFALSYDSNGPAADGHINGPRFGINANGFTIRAVDGTITNVLPSVANGGASAGVFTDWFRIRLVMDFTANGGDGSGSLFYMNLTNSETTFTPVAGLQDIDLKLASIGRDPSTWNALFLRLLTGSSVDNLKPSNATLPDTAAPLIKFRGKRNLKPGSRPTTVKGKATDDATIATIQFRASTGDKKTIASGRMAHPFRFKFRNRKHKRRVRVSVTAIDSSGNQGSARRVYR